LAKTTRSGRRTPKPAAGPQKKTAKKRFPPLLLFNAAVASLLAILVLVLAVSVLKSGKRIRGLEDRLVEINTQNSEKLDLINQTALLLARDSNIIRTSVGLPIRDYPLLRADEDDQTDGDPELIPLLRGIDIVIDRYQEELSLSEFAALKDNTELKELIQEHSLAVREEADLTLVLFRGYNTYFRVRYLTEDRAIAVSGPAGESTLPIGDIPAMIRYIRENIIAIESYYRELEAKASQLSQIEESKSVSEILEKQGLAITSLEEDDVAFRREVNLDNRTLLQLLLIKRNGVFAVSGKNAQSFEEYLPLVVRTLDELDMRTDQERLIQEKHEFLIQAFKDAGINAILEEKGVAVSTVPRENDYFLFYDIYQGEDKIGSFALEKYNLDIYLLDKDEVQLTSLKSLSQATIDEKKN
jgi:hypothetical protein